MQSTQRLGWLAPSAFILIWSSGYVAAKAATPHADPRTFLSRRYAGVVLLMALLARVYRAPWPSRRKALWLVLAGMGLSLLGVYLVVSKP